MNVRLLTLIICGALAGATLQAGNISAAITSFNVENSSTAGQRGYSFNQSPTVVLTPGSNTATVTNETISCLLTEGTCNAAVWTFQLTASNVSTTLPLVITMDGTLSGSQSGSGLIDLAGLGALPGFTINAGSFNTTLVNMDLPSQLLSNGNLSVEGTLNLTLGAQQVLTLPSSFVLTVNSTAASVPEPTSMALLGLGLAGIAIAVRRRRA